MVKFATNVIGAMLLPSLIQVTESISGSVVPLAMFFQAAYIWSIKKQMLNTFLVSEWLISKIIFDHTFRNKPFTGVVTLCCCGWVVSGGAGR